MTPLAALTGVSGFLGGHVAAAFEAAGWRLRALTRRDPRLDIGPEPVELVLGDLDRPDALAALTRGADAVVHVAGVIRGRRPEDFLPVNRDGTAALARAWREGAPSALFVLVSSLAARAPRISPYAASKRAGEDAAQEIVGEALRVLRPAAVYGPGDRETLSLFKAARMPVQPMLGPPQGRVALVHAADVAAAVLAAASGAPAGLYEVADPSPEGYAWSRIVEQACRAVGARPRR
ncbi:MAG: NAD(P)-dependent oxidoreductase, partial [Pseudomonadota bacterium]